MYEDSCSGGASLRSTHLHGLDFRLTTFLLAANMFIVCWTAEQEMLFSVFSDPRKTYRADPYTLLFVSLLVFVFGKGFFPLGAGIAKSWRKRA
jgi:putative oxidoreductase